MQVHAFGAKPNTEALASFGDALTSRGFVRVNENLEVRGHPGVFAAGDIVDWEEQKQAMKAMAHASIVAANVVSFVQDKPLKKVYKGSPEMIIIPLGKVRVHCQMHTSGGNVLWLLSCLLSSVAEVATWAWVGV